MVLERKFKRVPENIRPDAISHFNPSRPITRLILNLIGFLKQILSEGADLKCLFENMSLH